VPDSPTTGIAVTGKISFLAFLMIIFKPVIEIDGHPHDGAWSRVVVPTGAGQHRVSVYWKYLWFMPVNRADVAVTVTEGTTTEVVYRARAVIFLPGRIDVDRPVPVSA
jgi:hypothetical protein